MTRPRGQDLILYLDERRLSLEIAGSVGWSIGRAPVDDFALEDEWQEYVASNFMTPGQIGLDYYFDDVKSAFEYEAGRVFTVMAMTKTEPRAPLFIIGNCQSIAPLITSVVRDTLVRETDSLQPMGPTANLGRSFWSQAREIASFDETRADLPVNSTSGGTDFGEDEDNLQRGLMVAWRADVLDGPVSIVVQRIEVDGNGDEIGRSTLRTIALSTADGAARAGILTFALDPDDRVQRYGAQLVTGAGSTSTDDLDIKVYAARYGENFAELT